MRCNIKRISAAVCAFVMTAVAWAAFLCVPAAADTTYKAVLVDLDDCIPDTREAALTQYMLTTANKIDCNIGVVITADLNGKTDTQYSEGFLNDNFGRGSSSVVLMLLNTHDNPAYANYYDKLSLDGRGYDYYDRKANKIFDRVYKGLDSSGFEQAVTELCDALVKYKGGSGGISVSVNIGDLFGAASGGMFVGLILAIAITHNVAVRYTKKAPLNAASYLDRSRANVTRKSDIFIREYTRTYTSSSTGSHSGGGHSSHSGHHRSGGHSSHSGRHR